jgi:DNA-damage-inducible protein J
MGYNLDVTENAVVRSRISIDIKNQASAVLAPLGLTVSDVMRIVLTRVAEEGALPFELTPNKLTRTTLRKSARGQQVHRASNAEELFDQLDI